MCRERERVGGDAERKRMIERVYVQRGGTRGSRRRKKENDRESIRVERGDDREYTEKKRE